MGTAPGAPGEDWVVLVRPANFAGASVTRYGNGCSGMQGLPTMAADGDPALGNAEFGLRLRAARANAPATLLLGSTSAALPLGGGCTLWVAAPSALGSNADGGGVARWLTPIPSEPALLGGRVYATSFALDAQGAYLGIAAISDGLDCQLGY